MNIQYYKNITKEIFSNKNSFRDLMQDNTHWLTDGESKETILRNVIKKYLPQNVKVGKGFIINHRQEKSTQIDILIYKDSSPIVFRSDDLVCITSDSVLGIIEVKSKINNKNHLIECLGKLADIAELIDCKSIPKFNIDYDHERIKEYLFPVFVGLFSFESAIEDIGFTLKSLADITDIRRFRIVTHVCLGKSQFYNYWLNEFYAYSFTGEAIDVAPAYFITNLIGFISPDSTYFNRYVWFPKEKGGKKSYLKGNIPLYDFSLSAIEKKDNLFIKDNIEQLKKIEGENIIYGPTLIEKAVKIKDLDMVKFLISNGANIDSNDGMPLSIAISENSNDIAEYLIKHSNNLFYRYHNVLEEAISRKNKYIVELLIEKKFLCNTNYNKNRNYLHTAARNNDIDICKVLLKNGLDINQFDKKGNTPIFLVAHSSNYQLFSFLFNNGANLHKKNKNNETLLHISSMAGNTEIVKALIENNIEINAKDNFGMSALNYAHLGGHSEIIEILIKYDAKKEDLMKFDKAKRYFLKVAKIISDILNLPVGQLNYLSSLDANLGFDSLDAVEIIMALEDEFEVEILEEDAIRFESIRDIVNYFIDKC